MWKGIRNGLGNGIIEENSPPCPLSEEGYDI
jgi:hypothetical protein